MDWKFWVPLIVQTVGVYLTFHQIRLMRNKPALSGSTVGATNMKSYWPIGVMLLLMIGAWVPWIPYLLSDQGAVDWKAWNEQRMESVHDQTFRNREVVMDGKSFINCTFENVTFAYEGKGPLQMIGNAIVGTRVVKAPPAFDAHFVLLQGIGYIKPEIQRMPSGK